MYIYYFGVKFDFFKRAMILLPAAQCPSIRCYVYMLVTARIRRMGKVMFSVCPHLGGGGGGVPISHNALQPYPEFHGADTCGGVPSQVQLRGTLLEGTLPGGTLLGGTLPGGTMLGSTLPRRVPR